VSESTALFVVVACTVLAVAAAYVALALADSPMGLLIAAVITVGCLGAHVVSRVVMHYGAVEDRRKREEIILSR
jgi:hypothetical protein